MLVPTPVGRSDGMALSISCSDGGRIDVQSGLRRLLAAHPEYEAVGSGSAAACPTWRTHNLRVMSALTSHRRDVLRRAE